MVRVVSHVPSPSRMPLSLDQAVRAVKAVGKLKVKCKKPVIQVMARGSQLAVSTCQD
jgi:hypothetical protein